MINSYQMTWNIKRYMLSRNMSFLREGDNERCIELARTMLGKMETDPHFIDSICFSVAPSSSKITLRCLACSLGMTFSWSSWRKLVWQTVSSSKKVWTYVSIKSPHYKLTFNFSDDPHIFFCPYSIPHMF